MIRSMLLNILVLLKTSLYVTITEIKFNKLLVFLLTSLISIVILEVLNRSKLKYKRKIRLIFYSILSLIMFIDVVYYIQFSTLPSIALLGQVRQLSAVSDSVKYLLSIRNLFLIIDLPIILIIEMNRLDRQELDPGELKLQSDIDRQDRLLRLKNIFFKLVISLLACTFISTIALDRFDSVKSQELYTYHLTDLVDTLLKKDDGQILTKADIIDLEKRRDIKEGKYTGIGRDKNLIVIQVEALQNFVVGLNYQGQEVTPELNKLIKDKATIYYDNYYQLVGRGNTSDAEFVSQNSLHPSMEEPSYTRYEKNTFYGLPQLLKDKGYRTVAMHGHDGDYWNRRKAYKNQGFETFLDEDFYKVDHLIGLGVGDEDFFMQNVGYLKDIKDKEDNPFYAFMVTLTSHTPYRMPERYRELEILPDHKGTILGNYLQAIHYTDKQIGLLVDQLKEAGLYDDTVLAIYGDHYAISSAHEDDQKLMTDFLGYNYDYDEMMNIPLIIHVPGEDIKTTISSIGSQIDFYPTILNIMGYKNEKGLIFGRDLSNYEGYNLVAPQTYMRKGSFIDNKTTFVISRDGIFDHSRAYEKDSKKDIEDIEDLKLAHEMAISEINKSDYILNNNLLKEYIENDGKLDLNNLKSDSKLALMEIYQLEDYSLEELNKTYNKGEKVFLIDLNLDDKGRVVVGKGDGLSIRELANWLTSHMDVKLILRSKKDEVDVLTRAYEEVELDDSVVMIRDFESYLDVTNNMYRDVIVDPSKKEYNSKQLRDFISRYPGISILVDDEIEEGKLKELSRKGIELYRYKN